MFRYGVIAQSRNSRETGLHILFRKFQFNFVDVRVNSSQSKMRLKEIPYRSWPSPDLVQIQSGLVQLQTSPFSILQSVWSKMLFRYNTLVSALSAINSDPTASTTFYIKGFRRYLPDWINILVQHLSTSRYLHFRKICSNNGQYSLVWISLSVGSIAG